MWLRRLLQALSWIALAAAIVPPLMFLTGTLDLDQSKSIMLLATCGWFLITPWWMGREAGSADA